MPFEINKRDLKDIKSDILLQSSFWGFFKSEFEWEAKAFTCQDTNSGRSYDLLVLVKSLKAGMSLAYIPHGPSAIIKDLSSDNFNSKEISEYLSGLSRTLKSHLPKVLFIRWDVPFYITGDYRKIKLFHPLIKSEMDIQPPSTTVLDLRKNEEELLSSMKRKTRYNIGLAEKKNVEIRAASFNEFADWYALYKETALRDKIAIHSYDYYNKLFELSADKFIDPPSLKLYFAEHEGELLAGIIVAVKGEHAVYLYGASSNNKRNLMPSYALQWEAIKQAKADGALYYDFFGIPPFDDPGHPMHGLYRFKTGFAGDIIHRPGCWDYPVNKFMYSLFRFAEKLRYIYFKKIRKR